MRKNLSIFLALLLCISLILPITGEAKVQNYSDVADHWAKDYINWASEAGIIQGYGDGSFKPQKKITRAEYYRIANQSTPETLEEMTPVYNVSGASFEDVPSDAWYEEEVTKGLQQGYLSPPSEEHSKLNPNQPITREEAIYILVYIQGWSTASPAAYEFTDCNSIDKKKIGHIGAAVEHGVIEGYPDGTIKPKGNLTRAEVVTMLAKYEQGVQQDHLGELSKRPLEDWYWNFTNSEDYFPQGYKINDKIIDQVYAHFSPSDTSAILEEQDRDWGGSCFGFASTVGMYNCYLFDVKPLSASGIDNIAQIKDDGSYNAQSAINVYQSSWCTGSFQDFLNSQAHIWAKGPMEKSNNSRDIEHTYNEVKHYIDEFKGSGAMSILSLYWMEDGVNVGHAVSAYDYKEDGDKLEVFLYDPNQIAKSIVIDKGADRIYGEDFMTNGDYGGHDLIDFNCLMIFDAYGFHKAFEDGDTSSSRYLVDNNPGNFFTLTHKSGDHYRTDGNYDFMWNQSPDFGARVYTLRSSESYTLKSNENEVDFAIIGQDKRLGVTSDHQSEVVIDDNYVEIKDQSGDFSISITDDKGLTYGEKLTVEGKTTGSISVRAKDIGYEIKGDDLKGLRINNFKARDYDSLRIDKDAKAVLVKNDHGRLYIDDQAFINSRVNGDKQLINEDYVEANPNDPIVGSWYGQGWYGKYFPVDSYFYITHLEGDQYKIITRVIKQGDPSSEFYSEQYGRFDSDRGILSLDKSHKIYGRAGYFVESKPKSTAGKWYMSKNGTHLGWGERDNPDNYFDKY